MSSIPYPAGVQNRLPSGTVTFVFTDIEGSTQRWERHPAAMEDAVRRHDGLVRAALTEHAGHVFKTIGDAFCAAFARPEDAVAAVLAAQRALGAEDFSAVDGVRVRVAIHTGTADERDGDYFGPTVNRVARLLAIAHGGQVLISGVSAALVQGALPPQTALRDLGDHRLKDLARPEHVYQLLGPDLPAEFPALRSLDALHHNLPVALTSFVGRETEIAEITALLGSHRLVTLTGAGGIGKTRTSLQVAANLLDGRRDGVWFIELAPLSSGDYIPSTVAQIFGLQLPSNGDPVENLARALEGKHALLVFDNCEHLVEPAARVVATLLRGCPRLSVLASSRQALGIAGEAMYRLPTFAVPPSDASAVLSAREAGQCAAIALFAERAQAADQRFALSDDNAPVVADICRRLDGIPLALELAAARVKLLSPRQLRERLEERFRLLTGGSRDALPRQQTLRALIDWSHDLLDDRERALFRRLGIFVNGFTLEGAVAVGSGTDLDEFDVFDVLASLVDKSLVLAEPAGEALRYRLLESTRVYAAEKLAAAGERELCAGRHLRYLRDLFAAAQERFERTGRHAGVNDVCAAELEDVRAALDRVAGGLDAPLGAALLVEFGGWSFLGLDGEGLTRLEAYLATLPAGADPRLLARLAIRIGWLAWNCGQRARSFEATMQAIAFARASGDAPTLAMALREFGWSAASLRKFDEADAALREAEAIPGVPIAVRLRLLETRAFLSKQWGDPAASLRAHEQLQKEHRALGNVGSELNGTLMLADDEHELGQTPRAVELVREVLPALRARKNRNALFQAMTNLAGYLVAVHDLPGACTVAREVIAELAPREPDSALVAVPIEHLALALARAGDMSRAAALAGYADAVLQRAGFEREFNEQTTQANLVEVLAERLPPDDLARQLIEGAGLTPEAAIALALEEP